MWIPPPFFLILSVLLVGALNYALARNIERKDPEFNSIFVVVWGCLVLYLLLLLILGWIEQAVVLVVLLLSSWFGGVAHRASGGASKGGFNAWVVMNFTGIMAITGCYIFVSLFPNPRTFQIEIFSLIFTVGAYVAPSATAIFLRLYQTLKLRPGVEGSVSEREELET